MSCFPCFGKKKKKETEEESSWNGGSHHAINVPKNHDAFKVKNSDSPAPSGNIQAQSFTFRELATATKNFTPDSLLGEGGLGRVYKGSLENGQTVAVKQLGRNSLQGSREFLVEVLMLSLLHHPNLVNLVGYCADGDQRLLVYEFMPRGSLEDHLFDLKPDQKPLDWFTRMKIAFGAGQGLEYLHDKANPPVIYRDLKTSSILLDDLMTPRLSDFGLAKLGPMGDRPVIASSVMDTYGYCAPEYSRNGQLTLKSDVYSFGVILLELITGRRALDTSKPTNEQNLVAWAQPMFHDQKKYPELADPNLQGNYPLKGLNQAVAVAAMCIQDEASVRPFVADIVMTLSFLIEPTPTPQPSPTPTPDRARQAQESPHHSKSSDSDSSGEHVVETLQLGLTSRQGQGSKPGSHSNSKRSSSSGSDSSSSSKHSKKYLLNSNSKQGKESLNSSSKHHEELSSDGSDRSLCSKRSEGSSKFGSSKFLSMKQHSRGSYDGSDDERHSKKSEDNEYESD